jgi:predicted transcriptional regulator
VSSKSKQGSKKPRRMVVGIYLDDEVADRVEHIEQARDKVRIELERTRPRRLAEYAAAGVDPEVALENVQREDAEGLAQIEGDLAAANEALDEATTWFVFEANGARRLRAMVLQHPPTEQQKADATARGQELAWNPDTFPRALVEDCCVSPADVDWDEVFAASEEGDDEHAGGLPPKSAWSAADVEVLVATAIAVNQSLRTADKARQPSLRALTEQG